MSGKACKMLSISTDRDVIRFPFGVQFGKAACVAYSNGDKSDVTLQVASRSGSIVITGTIEHLQDLGAQLITATHQWIIDNNRDDLLEDFEQEICERMQRSGNEH